MTEEASPPSPANRKAPLMYAETLQVSKEEDPPFLIGAQLLPPFFYVKDLPPPP